MLRKRSRVMSSKPNMMSDHVFLSSRTDNYGKPTSSIFNSTRLFTGFSSKGPSDSEAAMSPTSILDSKPFLGIGSSFSSDKYAKLPKPCIDNRRRPWEKIDSRGVGLGLVDALYDNNNDKIFCKPDSGMILFGSQLKIQIPPLPSSTFSPFASPGSPIDFGIKTRFLQSGPFSPMQSPCSGVKNPSGSAKSGPELLSPKALLGRLSPREMELSEDYTCVISHGPNPRTTHIFDNCIVENCGVGFCASRKENGRFANQSSHPSPGDFLSFCHACKKKLGPGEDIYMYRGEKAFCSLQCRSQEMLLEEGVGSGASGSLASHSDDIFTSAVLQ